MAYSKNVLAENMRAIRARQRISQADLAERTGLSADLIYKYENEVCTPGADKAYAIAEALGVTLDELLGFSEG